MGLISGALGLKEIVARFCSQMHHANPYLESSEESTMDSHFFRNHLVSDIKVNKRVTEWSFIYQSHLVDKMCVCATKSGQKLLLGLKMDAYCPSCQRELSCALDEVNFLVKGAGIHCATCNKEKVEWSVVVAIYLAKCDNLNIFCVDFDQHQNIGFGTSNTLARRSSVESISTELKRVLPQKVDISNNHLLGDHLPKLFKYRSL